MRIENKDERNFYEMQSLKEGWGKRELQRQYGSSLYERLLLGKDKDKILAASQKGLVLHLWHDRNVLLFRKIILGWILCFIIGCYNALFCLI